MLAYSSVGPKSHTDRHTYIHTDRQICIHTDRHTDRHKDRQHDRAINVWWPVPSVSLRARKLITGKIVDG